jgi:hypothetical protein
MHMVHLAMVGWLVGWLVGGVMNEQRKWQNT